MVADSIFGAMVAFVLYVYMYDTPTDRAIDWIIMVCWPNWMTLCSYHGFQLRNSIRAGIFTYDSIGRTTLTTKRFQSVVHKFLVT